MDSYWLDFTDTNKGEGSERDITVDATVHGIHWETIKNHLACTIGGIGARTGNDGTYESAITVKGFSDEAHENQVGVWYE